MFKCCDKETGFGEGFQFVPRWGFIIPHTKDAGGAQCWDKSTDEYMYGYLMIREIGLQFSSRNQGGTLQAAKNLAEMNVNATIEPHFNAFNGKVRGAEILVMKGDSKSEYYAENFLSIFADTFPNRRIRGVKKITPGERGYLNLKAAKRHVKVALLTELFFGDNPNDWISLETQAGFWRDCLR